MNAIQVLEWLTAAAGDSNIFHFLFRTTQNICKFTGSVAGGMAQRDNSVRSYSALNYIPSVLVRQINWIVYSFLGIMWLWSGKWMGWVGNVRSLLVPVMT